MGRRRTRLRLQLTDTTGILTPRMIAARRNGALGGRARAVHLSSEEIQKIGEKAGAATLARYGPDYYRFIRTKSKRNPVKT